MKLKMNRMNNKYKTKLKIVKEILKLHKMQFMA